MNEHIKTLLRQIFTGWILYENSYDQGEYTRTENECFIEAAGGDVIQGGLLGLFSHWGNDVQGLAPHYGLALDRGKDGKLCIREDIPPAPSPEHWWHKGEWVAPGQDPDDEETAI